MKFYDRENELNQLLEIEELSLSIAQMCMVVGRRRIGKTTLIKKAFQKIPMLYFFVAKKNEILLCEEFSVEIENKLGLPLGKFTHFKDLFKALMIISKNKNFTLVIDEFQEFFNINPSVYSDMQNTWDEMKDQSQINLVLCGSIFSMMNKIFENSKEPLFGRMTFKMHLKPFQISTLKEILSDFNPNYTAEDLLTFYMITGGVAKYIEQLVISKAFTKQKMLHTIFRENSYFIQEGRDVLIEEFGKDYLNYFSILSLIASSKTSRSEIESVLNIQVGAYLERLEKDFNIIKKLKPFGAKEGSRFNKYFIEDNFLNFWFRFIYKSRSAVEIGNLTYIMQIVERDYEVYSGIILEKYFKNKLTELKKYASIDGWWNRKGENEIDIVAVNDFEKIVDFFEVKRNKQKINLFMLEQKAKDIIHSLPGYKPSFTAFSMEDM